MLAPFCHNQKPNLIFFWHKGAGKEPLHWNQTSRIKGLNPKTDKGDIGNCVTYPIGAKIVTNIYKRVKIEHKNSLAENLGFAKTL